MSGKLIRLNRLIKPHRPLLSVPMDHGLTIGPVSGLTDMGRIVSQVAAGGADAVIIHKGLARQISQHLPETCHLIVHLSASTQLAPDSTHKELIASVEEAVRLGATAVSVHVNLGSASESQMLKDMGFVAEQCDRWGIPLLAMMYVRDGKKENEYNPTKIAHAARVAEEIGADIIKINYTGDPDSFRMITKAVQPPVVIAGGPKIDSNERLLSMIQDAMQAGARGVAIGRNIFQDPAPQQLTAHIRSILDQPGRFLH
ncbi:2-amino-3,7-dideoxy-D-threo-hept-6-ulosonate synthase [Heliophilum fasciatum]|uniref:2-amino-3,7-dideoxy-D-threo-hept-6-ulosonate synthase n=1 Tax=Heliophilum fasciatum TaxID=35700 RepID=A0A4R2RZA3_9FIRM|nr:2-amino-3,7-dideoxy-D-threo-hept-6-ulosonate synthase [Heliophilum fasciatum]MCW2276755.1 putative phospho-2-dehydro-3-deoxyheptonate aldolase [Heliophilum fasciatum]TCP68864.1 2-amino-3,7-dideoxy-D-threo-hept-6-ulosonate synthase [Heliophilum fasciatum]